MGTVHGYNSAVAAGTETIFPGGTVWLPPTTARTHAIVSSSTDDDGSPAGTGALTVRVHGLKSGIRVTETVTMNGTTPVNTASTYDHIEALEVLTVGSGGVNAGTITATAATDSTITAAIEAGMNRSNGAIIYNAVIGDRYHIRGVTISASALVDGATSVEVRMGVKRGGQLLHLTHIVAIWSGSGSVVTIPLDLHLYYGDWVRFDATSTDANVRVAATILYSDSI